MSRLLTEMEENRQEKLLVLDTLLSRAIKDPVFRRKFFSDYDKMLKSHDMPEQIGILIKKCISDLTK
ncbi:MAG TPA: hypothetical protein VH415_05060 [Nitrososphaeraceae archaeon]